MRKKIKLTFFLYLLVTPSQNVNNKKKEATFYRLCVCFQNPITIPDESHLFDDFTKTSRWFLLPSEANKVLRMFSQLSSLGPAKPFMIPNQTDSSTTCRMWSLKSPGRSTTTSLGSSGYESGSSGNAPNQVGKGKAKGKPVHVQKIKVQGYQNRDKNWVY